MWHPPVENAPPFKRLDSTATTAGIPELTQIHNEPEAASLSRTETGELDFEMEKIKYLDDHPADPRFAGFIIATPIFRFWVECLNSENKYKADRAYYIFKQACEKSIDSAVPSDWPKDLSEIKRILVANQLKGTVGDIESVEAKPEILEICKAVLPMLLDPKRSDGALEILNSFTMYIYDEKDINWWTTEFMSSKFAGILHDLPMEEWIRRPE